LNSPETGGRFRVWLFEGKEGGDEKGKGKGELVWDRKVCSSHAPTSLSSYSTYSS
jgi:hypothetical protein